MSTVYFYRYTSGIKGLHDPPCLWSKTTLITGGVGMTWVDPPFCKTNIFFLGPWLLVCQFIEISNQMELTCKVSNFENKNLS